MHLSEDQRIMLESVRRMAVRQIAPLADEIDREGKVRWDVVGHLADMGLLQIFLPPKYGGLEKDRCLMFSLFVEEVAKACPSSALHIIIQAVGSFPIVARGLPEQKERFFPRLATGKELMGYLVTEPHGGSDVASIKTRATPVEGGYLLRGRKCFATNGGVASLYTVLGYVGGDRLTFFVVEREAPGLSVGKEIGRASCRERV